MDLNMETMFQMLIPVGIVILTLLLGIIVQWLLIHKLGPVVGKTRWEGDDVIIKSFKGTLIIWFLIAGIYLALPMSPLSEKATGVLQKIIFIVLLISITWVIAKMGAGVTQLYVDRQKAVLLSTSIFKNVVKGLIILIGALVILNTMGVSITPLITALGVGGLAVALALQEPLANLFAGIHIIASAQLKAGDFVKLDTGDDGYVVDVSWRTTTIRALTNNLIVIPNAKLAAAITRNFNLPQREMSVIVQVGVSYDSDLEHVENVTKEIAKQVVVELEGGVTEWEPFIRYHTFNDFSIDFAVILRAREYVDQFLLKSEFVKRLHKRYKEEGIEIPFPIRTVHLQKTED